MKLKEIFTLVTKSVTPQPDVHYHLYSLPSFDENQTREEVKGREIMSNKLVVPNKCILFNKLNVRFKRVWMIDNQDSNKLASTEFLPLVVNEDKVDFKFAYYLLISDIVTNYLSGQNSNTSGSHKRINSEVLLDINVNLPSRAEQERIGKLLSELDAKIALNREINRNLEAMARQLYDYWFVQFDFPDENGRPYKSSGGKMVWNEKLKREIPAGWEVKKIVNIEPNIITGKTPSTSRSEYFGGNIPFVTIDDIRATRFVRISTRTLTDIGASTQSSKYLPYGSLMCSCIGTVGVMGFCGCVLQTNQQINSIVFTNYRNAQYIFIALEKYFKSTDAKVGNILPNMSKQEFGDIPVIYPTSPIITKFAELSRCCFEHISVISKEIETLTCQRDELLPLLMNGQVSVMPTEVNCDLSHD